jgi:hypothetical protein
MRLRIVPASTGVTWVKLGCRAFSMQPFALTALFCTGMLSIQLIASLPLVGMLLGLVLTPAFTLALMVATAQATQNQRPQFLVLLAAFRSSRQQVISILIVGLIFALAFIGIAQATTLVDGGLLLNVLYGKTPMKPELMENSLFRYALSLMSALYALLSMLVWHVPGLIHWHKTSPFKAMFFSTIACLRNFTAFIVYGLALGVVGLCGSVAMGLVGGVLAAIGFPSPFLLGMLMIFSTAVLAMLTASQVFSFRDCFEPPDTLQANQADNIEPTSPSP